jgi:tetratricopeptide (TPR) repeat protein
MARELLQQNLFVNVALTDLVQRQDLSASLRDLVAQELHALGDLGPEQLLEIALSVVTEHERSNTAYQRARLAAETASLRQPENALALATLGAAQLRLGETSAALATCDRALELQQAAPGADSAGDDSAFVHAFRGLCLARQDRAGAATQELATAREQGQGSSSQQLLGCIAELEGALSPR